MFRSAFTTILILINVHSVFCQNTFEFKIPEKFDLISHEIYYVGNDYSVVNLKGNSKTQKIVLLNSQKESVSQFTCSDCSLEMLGFSKTDQHVFLYLNGWHSGRRLSWLLKLEKKPNTFPLLTEFVFKGLESKDDLITQFDFQGAHFKIYKNNTTKSIRLIKFSGSEVLNNENFNLDNEVYSQIKKQYFKYISSDRDIDFSSLSASQLYFINNKLVLSFSFYDLNKGFSEKITVKLDKTPIITRLKPAKSLNWESYVLGDSIFFFHQVEENRENELLIEAYDLNSKKKFFSKSFKEQDSSLVKYMKTPIINTIGDTSKLDISTSKGIKKTIKIFQDPSYLTAHKSSTGNLIITLVRPVIVTNASPYGASQYESGVFNFLRMAGTLDKFDLVSDLELETPYLKAVRNIDKIGLPTGTNIFLKLTKNVVWSFSKDHVSASYAQKKEGIIRIQEF
jgi:hypothetical protein